MDNGPYIFAMGAYDSSRKIIDKATEKGQLPPPIRGSFVRELLDDGQCICGMDIAHKGPHRKKIERGILEIQNGLLKLMNRPLI